MVTRIKICCISSPEEARLAVNFGADAIGLVGQMPSGPGVIEDALIRKISRQVPPAVSTFLLTQRETAEEIASHVIDCGTDTVQVVRHIEPEQWRRLDQFLPRSVRRVQVIHVEDQDVLGLIGRYARYVDAFLLDSGRPSETVPKLGGTGSVHDWDISAKFVQQSPKPVFLAGGLAAANVLQAIETVQPFGIDVCSSIRSGGTLVPRRLQDLITKVRNSEG